MDKSDQFSIILRLLKRLIVAFAILAVANGCHAKTPKSPDNLNQFQGIIHAVFADGRLWLLHDDGSLAYLMPAETKVHQVDIGGKILGICNSKGGFSALVEKNGMWALKQLGGKGWVQRTSVSSKGQNIIALDCDASRVGATLVTNGQILEMTENKVRSTNLSQTIEHPRVKATALVTSDALWLGLNNGEWGGGLRRISLHDGRVETIELNRSGELCGGPLNTDCDPVNGLIIPPWNPSCIVAAIGMVHMMSHGRIVEICDHNIRRLYFKPFNPQPPQNTDDDGEPESTIAFFGLARLPNGMMAIGVDGIYRFNEAQSPQFQPLPKFENRNGYRVNFDDPNVALVLTDVNGRASMSGSVPLMAIR